MKAHEEQVASGEEDEDLAGIDDRFDSPPEQVAFLNQS